VSENRRTTVSNKVLNVVKYFKSGKKICNEIISTKVSIDRFPFTPEVQTD